VHADFQKALDDALPGDTIELAAGEVFEGPFTLPKKTGQGTIVVRTSATNGDLPPPGTRVSPSHAGAMPKLQSSADVVLRAAPGARGYRFIGIEIRPQPGHSLVNLVDLGTSARSFEDLPGEIVFERCYLHGDPERGTRRGIAMNSMDTAVLDSYLSDFKDASNEAQAIAGWAGPGPFKIVNNYLEGAGENVIFGGSDPPIPQMVPADIEIRRNHLRKPLHWKPDDPSYDGSRWVIKNLLELKNARRVLIEGNLLENNWRSAQNGMAILFTVRNQDGRSPWSVVEDVTFANNHLRRADGGINILGRDRTWPSGSGQTRRILIRNNLFEDVGGRLFQLLDQSADVVIDHNSALNSGPILVLDSGPHTGFVFRNNIALHNEYGIAGTGTSPGNASIEAFLPGALIRRNVLVGANGARYPADNFYPGSLAEVGFVDVRSGDFRLASTSPFRKAGTDGRDPGVDFQELSSVQGGATASAPGEEPTSMPQPARRARSPL
jgi:hypothetical protein